MVGLGLGHWLTRGMGAPPPLKPMPTGYGGAWVGGMSLVWPWRARHVTLLALLARPTPGFKPTPMGPRPNPSPRGGGLGVFSQPTPQPKPHTPQPNSPHTFTLNSLTCPLLHFTDGQSRCRL
ncbi:hypothetical protein Hanom_Chr17g01583401 [Helianthus anomalus]